ncbi:MAG: galactose mutarotase [Bacteroidales bacterium]|nr:galactose mutarotase [Bacteroidales bacterium]
MKSAIKLVVLAFICLHLSCKHSTNVKETSDKIMTNTVQKENFIKTLDGKEISLYTLKNKNGMLADITNYGGKIVTLFVPDKEGNFADVVTGFNKIDTYLTEEIYFGALIGRYGNRIANGKFSIDGKEYTLVTNNGKNHLHGGIKGFHNVVWDVKEVTDSTLTLHYLSKDMEEGYPGNLDVNVTYTLTDDNALKINYEATTDKKTVLNLTNHAFFNLAGEDQGSILNTELTIYADSFTPTDNTSIPTGEIKAVKGTPFDFATATAIGKRIQEDNQQLQFGSGYDHNFVLNKNTADELSLAAKAKDPVSGRVMDVYTTEPGIQFYTGNFLNGSTVGKGGKAYEQRTSFCLETQHYPDSPNQPSFPSTLLAPGEKFQSTTIYKFSVTK